MRRKPKVGLLPLYLKLYDDTFPELRQQFEPFLKRISEGLIAEGLEVERGMICRLSSEFSAAMEQFEKNNIDLIVTVHLAYSLSLAAIDALTAASIPLLLLDTTMDYEFGSEVDPERMMFNHGIHGVQDLASVLRRRKRLFHIVAGHAEHSDLFHRAADIARAAYAARCLRGMQVLRIGNAFAGMGDFDVDESILMKQFGIAVDSITPDDLADAIEAVKHDSIDAELQLDRERFYVEAGEDVHRRSVRVGLGLRAVLERGRYGALSANFQAFDKADGPVDTVPFLEISKAMSRGLGYAGEGDVLTASLVGALNQAFNPATFTEAFCPDWKNDAIFISHMGEINPDVSCEKPLLCEKEFPWTAARNPAMLACAPAPGPATLVNLAPGPDDSFTVIAAGVRILPDTENLKLKRSVRGWIQPDIPLTRFLEDYSRIGGTHHCALVMGDRTEAVVVMADLLGIEGRVLGA